MGPGASQCADTITIAAGRGNRVANCRSVFPYSPAEIPNIGEPWATKTEGAAGEGIFALAYAGERETVSPGDTAGS
jgi:hypothetical protein